MIKERAMGIDEKEFLLTKIKDWYKAPFKVIIFFIILFGLPLLLVEDGNIGAAMQSLSNMMPGPVIVLGLIFLFSLIFIIPKLMQLNMDIKKDVVCTGSWSDYKEKIGRNVKIYVEKSANKDSKYLVKRGKSVELNISLVADITEVEFLPNSKSIVSLENSFLFATVFKDYKP